MVPSPDVAVTPSRSALPTVLRRLRGGLLIPALPLLLAVSGCSAPPAADEPPALDVLVVGGRVIDPETQLDAVRDVGIVAGAVVEVAEHIPPERLAGDGVLVDASGLVVAPGFVDLHAHGQSDEAHRYQARDGVTTALELEWGYPRIATWLEERRGRSLVHYGASASQGLLRALAVHGDTEEGNRTAAALEAAMAAPEPLFASQQATMDTFYSPLTEEGLEVLRQEFERQLEAGALGIGMAHQYTPGASHGEVLRVFEYAAERDVPIFTHVRSMGLDAFQEVVANAAATGASVHIVHANSSGLGALPDALRLIEGASRRGVDVTTETYPYTAASTGIESSIFDEGWQERLGIDEGDVQWEATAERLTPETFARYRQQGGVVILHMMKPEMIDLAVSSPSVIIASDGMPYAPGAHPRTAGTFSRVLGRYVRERGVLDLPTAIAKMTWYPARRLESISSAMARKGRVQVGADADLTVFDPATIIDTATFEDDLSFSEGVRHVLVAGTFVVRDGELVEGVFPGQAVVGDLGRGTRSGSDGPPSASE